MIKIGLIGYNEGNGHPYSFSAIINGYDREFMSQCPYRVIYKYLSSRPSDELGLEEMQVTHIWCPDIQVAKDIARCSKIDHVVENYEDMLGVVDAVIIARDDVGSHYEIARFFLVNE